MHGPYPGELRMRVIDFVEEGGSRREAAEQFEVSVSSAIRWVQRFRENGTSEAWSVEGVLRHWRSTRGRSSSSSASNRTSR
jgi:transposase